MESRLIPRGGVFNNVDFVRSLGTTFGRPCSEWWSTATGMAEDRLGMRCRASVATAASVKRQRCAPICAQRCRFSG
jgi:hypothetical protein